MVRDRCWWNICRIILASCIRYDLTGEEVNPSIFYNSFMRELKKLEEAKGMEKFHETKAIDAFVTNDQEKKQS